MSRFITRLYRVAAILCLLGAGSAASAQTAPAEPRSVILILLDGFRWDGVDPQLTPTLHRLATSGIQGEMVPVWPPISSPNHWALVTGLYTKHGGPFHNLMWDPAARAPFTPTRAGFADGEPIWAGVVRAGKISAVIGPWAGVQQPEDGKRPSYQIPVTGFGTAVALQLLEQPAPTRPALLTLYTSAMDEAQHVHGVTSQEAAHAKQEVDRDVAGLIQGLVDRNLRDRVDIVIVADHGMLDTPNLVYMDQLMDAETMAVPPIGAGPVVSLWPQPGQEQVAIERVRAKFPHLRPYRPHEIPARYHCCDPSRVPPVMLLADPGWQMVDRDAVATAATHGFDNALPEMHALFIAQGPSFQPGRTIGQFNTVDVYSLLTELLHVRPKSSDGTITPFCSALAAAPAACRERQR